ncbi:MULTISPECIES: M1 family metallopeptidase [Empedobacter]|uniref:M1 family metallopeptidase n=1 Tax=Empedobacter falsenii TaxID=343874 RepID=A0A7H9DWG7_9FLAO|nr:MULTISPECIES: M1 family metallopeptidase [Empedobacter]MDH2207859.1 M1 family metallopeptidase [Empedobacter sp. GD03644]QLL59547.1 M1 family metallopeptidase [Empedobacter falsenii]
MRKFTLLICLCLVQFAFAQRKGYWQQKVDYKIDVDMKEKAYQYDGKMQLKYTNNSGQSLNKVYFHLYFNAFQPGSMMDNRLQNIPDPDKRMATNVGTKENPKYVSRISELKPDQIGYQKVTSLKQDGKAVSYKVDGTILEVTLAKPIAEGQTSTFDMIWNAQVPEQIRRSGRNSKDGVEFSMAQWYPKMAEFDPEGWHLDEYVGREFFAPFGNFDVTINIDKDYVVGASGELQNPNNVKGYVKNPTIKAKNGKVAWNFKAENIHDFVWAADKEFIVEHEKSKHGVDVYLVYQDNDKSSAWRQAMPYALGFFDYNSEHFGEYPWKTYSIIQGGDGGMEYGTATLIAGGSNLNSLIGTIFHEAAHSWYQQLFGINETYNEWFDEGFTSYVEQMAHLNVVDKLKVMPSNPNPDAYKGYINLALSGKEEPASLLADYYNTNYAYSLEAYYKGQVLAIQLGYIIGNDNLNKTFLEFYKQWKFKHPSGNDFKRVAEEVSGINLKWYFNLFINTTRKIDYAVEAVNGNTITIANKSDFAMPIDLLVEYTDGSKELFYIPLREMRGEKPAENLVEYQGAKRTILEDWFWTKPTYDVKVSKEVKQVTIDPTKRLADVNDKNNVFTK